MAKVSKVDTLALEQSNNDSFMPADMSADYVEAVEMLRQATSVLSAIAGTSDRQLAMFLEQLCGGTDFMLNGRKGFKGKRAWVAEKCADVAIQEQAKKDNVAGASARLDRAEAYRTQAENEERDLDMIDRVFREAYFAHTGTHFEPYQPKTEAPKPKPMSLSERIKAAQG